MSNDERAPWDARPALLALLGAGAGLAIHLITDMRPLPPGQLALALFDATLAVLLAFTVERERLRWSLAFSAVAATLVGLITWWSVPSGDWDSGTAWRMTCAFLAVAIAAPLFQTARDEGTARFPYADVHGHAWTNAVLWGAGWGFAGIVFALGWLIASLFDLIGVGFLRTLMREEWFVAILLGAAFGGAVGLLRERDRIVRTLLGVVLVVLRVLAPVLAVFLAAFLLFLPFTGLGKLWEATRSTTPVVLGCMIAALVLTNAVVGQDERDDASTLLRLAARVLSFTLLPLALIAAWSLGLRIAQHGLSVDRLWALVFVAVAVAYGLGYLVSVVRPAWAERLRQTNLRLAFGLCAVALLLALPILSFNRIATNDQVARLESGRITVDTFDWAALRYDFGDPGNAAVDRLSKSGTAAIRLAAADALRSRGRAELWDKQRTREQSEGLDARVRVLPTTASVPASLRDAIVQSGLCLSTQRCVLMIEPATALLVSKNCAQCAVQVQPFASRDGRWLAVALFETSTLRDAAVDLTGAKVEVREVRRRRVFVDDKPVGSVFE